MDFHNYRTMRPDWFRGTSEEYVRQVLASPPQSDPLESIKTKRSALEFMWHTTDRPFYNVYPIAVDLCRTTAMRMRWSEIPLPTKVILIRFAAGSEPFGIESVLVMPPYTTGQSEFSTFLNSQRRKDVPGPGSFFILGVVNILNDEGGRETHIWESGAQGRIDEEFVSETHGEIGTFTLAPGKHNPKRDMAEAMQFVVQMMAFIGLLANGNDLITPAILSKDRNEYESTTDESRRKWLESRAARRQGRGFDIGRSMEIERASSPHWRSRHLALFHTGQGRTKPVLKWRSGCVVTPTDLSSVPTGFLGKEKPGETKADTPIIFRTPVPKKMRFRVLRRDGYRCRLCGMTSEDGIKLHVDHIVPVAKGGKTDERNLWALCQPCNSGKSDSDLRQATETNKEVICAL